MSTLERAIAIAAEAHAGQVDKAGEPYILHPLRVMLTMKSAAGRIVGVLHDVIEDGNFSRQDLSAEGFEAGIVDAAAFLSRPSGLPYGVYIDGLVRRGSPLARAVKVADLRDNLSYERLNRLSPEVCDRLTLRYRPALERLALKPDLWGI